MKICIFLISLILVSCLSQEKTPTQSDLALQTRDIITNLNTPWEILWGPDNYIWMTERIGKISRVNPETGDSQLLLEISEAYQSSESGLLGMALHPQFQQNPYVYVAYNYLLNGNISVKLVRFTYNGSTLDNPVTLLDGITGNVIHDGSRLWITQNLKLFMTTGDAGTGNNAQNLSNQNGKILRMNLDGSVPDDNPFPGSLVWSFGHRNPQGLVMANGILYSSEHGPNTDDEINIIEKGRNYGWPNVMGYCDLKSEKQFCNDNNVAEPIISLYPTYTLAICGLDYYNHSLIPEWQNSLLLVTLKANKFIIFKLDSSHKKILSQTEYFTGEFGRLRDICISPEGKVYICTSNRDGRGDPKAGDDRIIEITPIKPTNVKGDGGKSLFRASPNPASGEITFDIDGLTNNNIELQIFNSFGTLVKTFILNEISEVHRILSWNGNDFNNQRSPAGVYFAILKGEPKFKTLKFVILR
jgi:aldose sugar dehydrogenase